MKAVRLLIPTMLAAGLLPLAAVPASAAAPPGNDEPQGAVKLHVGERVVQNTTKATTTAEDEALNANCGAPATNASVWYKFHARVARKVVLDMTASSYSGGMLIFKGTPTAKSLVNCGPDAVPLVARASKTYYIMVISDTDVNGGKLVLTLKKAQPPVVRVSVASQGVAFRGGAARIQGSYFCKNGDSGARLNSHLFQLAGRLKIQAHSGQGLRCDATRHRWSARLVSPTGTYAPGHALATVRIIACGVFVCRHDIARRHIQLVPASSTHRQWSAQLSRTRKAHTGRLVERQRYWPSS